MPVYEVRLWPRGSFEFRPRSDTLFGAICWAIRTLWDATKLEALLEDFHKAPAFLLTCAFPCQRIADGGLIHYLPRPLLPPLDFDKLLSSSTDKAPPASFPYHSPDQAKITWLSDRYNAFKKVPFIPEGVFHAHVPQAASDQPLFQAFLDGQLGSPSWRERRGMPKIMADRLGQSTGGAGQFFFQEEHFLSRDWGFYFLVRTNHWNDLLLPVLRYLEDSGLGRNARTGKNHFRLDWAAEPDWLPRGVGPRFVTLSHYCQAPEDAIDWESSTYDIYAYRGAVESRGEFAGAPVWKRRLLLVREGSCLFPAAVKDRFGSLAPVFQIHGKTIYHYGLAWPLYLEPPQDEPINA